jgi:hypothetical protein
MSLFSRNSGLDNWRNDFVRHFPFGCVFRLTAFGRRGRGLYRGQGKPSGHPFKGAETDVTNPRELALPACQVAQANTHADL